MKTFVIWNIKENEEELITHLKLEARKYWQSPDHDVYDITGRGRDRKIKALRELLYKRKQVEIDGVEFYIPVKITRTRTEEHNKKISEKMTGMPKTPEHCEAISDAMRGNANRSKPNVW